MGSAKHAMMEAEDCGWRSSDKCICKDCVSEPFLSLKASELENQACVCSYCGNKQAAALDDLMPYIMHGVFSSYADPSSACVPREDGDWVGDECFEMTEWVLGYLGVEAPVGLVNDLEGIIVNDSWVNAPEGYYYGSHRHEKWTYSWHKFCHLVKHQTRYFFQLEGGDDFDSEEMSPEAILFKIVEALGSLNLLRIELGMGRKFYRARIKDDSWEIAEGQLRQPPNEYANAGRMNPAGISYFYAAEDDLTAIKEVCKSVSEVAVAEFEVRESLTFLDLTSLPDMPSVFDKGNEDNRHYIQFLKGFIEDIIKPIAKDGKEHIDYVPTQIVSELFANQIKADDKPIDGIRFLSSINPEGINWVIFPRAFDKVKYNSSKLVETEIVMKELS